MDTRDRISERRNWPPGWKATIGLIFPWAFSGATYEYSLIFPEGVGIISAPIDLKELTVEALKTVGNEAVKISKWLYVADAIGFTCAVGSFVLGVEYDEGLVAGIEKASGKPATTLATAIAEGLKALGAKRMILVSPYPKEMTEIEVKYFAAQGVETVHHESLGLKGHDVNLHPLVETYKFAMQVYRNSPSADVIFLTCGGLPSAEIIAPLEKATGMPVISSNTCLIRQCLKLAKIQEPIKGYGKLLEMER